MMLLGLVLHTTLNYMVFPNADSWPYKDAQTSTAFDILVAFITPFGCPRSSLLLGFLRRGSGTAPAAWEIMTCHGSERMSYLLI